MRPASPSSHVTAPPAADRPLAPPEQLRRLFLVELRRFPALEKSQKHRHAHTLKGFCPAHPTPPKGAGLTGQFVRYLNRTYRLPPTAFAHHAAGPDTLRKQTSPLRSTSASGR